MFCLFVCLFVFSFSFLSFFLNIILRPYFAFPYPLLCFSLLLSSAIAYHFFSFSFFLSFFFNFFFFASLLSLSLPSSLLLFTFSFCYCLPFFFYVNAFKRHPSKQTSLNNVVYPRPAFIPGLSFCFTHFTLSLFFFFFFSYTYSRLSVLCGYLTFEISNIPSSLERKSNLMPETCPRKDFDPKREFVLLRCTRARQPPSRT